MSRNIYIYIYVLSSCCAIQVRAENTEPTAQFAVVNDLSKVLARKVTPDDLLSVSGVYVLESVLYDCELCVFGRCP